MFSKIIQEIENEQIITICPHVGADGDALGSCFGFAELIKHKYPDKEVYVIGTPSNFNGEYFPHFDVVSDEVVKNSLFLSLDTANIDRVDDQRVKIAKKVIKIDHHPNREPFGDLLYVDDTKAACTEIITIIGQQMYGEGVKFPFDAAKYLYGGLITDTMGFSTSSSNAHSLKVGSFLVDHGLNMSEISYIFNSREADIYNYITKVRDAAIIKDKFLYAIIKKEVYQEAGIAFNDAKNCVSEFVRVKGLKIWSLFVETDEEGAEYKYQGSLRSRDCICNDIAVNHNGGGHTVAAGCRIASDEELAVILKELEERANG